MAEEGRTVVQLKCPCSDAESTPPSPAPRVSYWVEAEAPGGFPVLLAGRCVRCGDRFCLLSPAGTQGLGKYQVGGLLRGLIKALPSLPLALHSGLQRRRKSRV